MPDTEARSGPLRAQPTSTAATSSSCQGRNVIAGLLLIVVAEDLARGDRAQRLPGGEADDVGDEVDGAVAEDDVHAAGMPAPRRGRVGRPPVGLGTREVEFRLAEAVARQQIIRAG